MQNPHFGSKIKIQKNMSKSILQITYSCFVQQTAPKNTKYSSNETILKIGHHAKPMQNPRFGFKIKIPKRMSNPFYKSFRVDLWKKPLQKTLTIREMGPF